MLIKNILHLVFDKLSNDSIIQLFCEYVKHGQKIAVWLNKGKVSSEL